MFSPVLVCLFVLSNHVKIFFLREKNLENIGCCLQQSHVTVIYLTSSPINQDMCLFQESDINHVKLITIDTSKDVLHWSVDSAGVK